MQAFLRLTTLALLTGFALSAQAVRITPAHSGGWYDPDFDKQGFSFEVLGKAGPTGPERIVAVYWFTYDDAGAPVWAIGNGVTDGDTVEMMMQRTFGGARPPVQQLAEDLQDFAEMTFTFGTCNTAVADFTMADSGEQGSYNLQRLTQIGATTCTGGMADEVEPGAEAIGIVAQFTAGAAYPDAAGHARFLLRPGYSEFDLSARKLPDGDYGVFVGGDLKGTLTSSRVGMGNGIGMGSLKFTAPETETTPLLDFDPRGQLVEIVDGGGEVALSVSFPTQPGPGD